jgi:hypothetical protein
MDRRIWPLVLVAVGAIAVLKLVFHVRVLMARGQLLIGMLAVVLALFLLWPRGRQPPR